MLLYVFGDLKVSCVFEEKIVKMFCFVMVVGFWGVWKIKSFVVYEFYCIKGFGVKKKMYVF